MRGITSLHLRNFRSFSDSTITMGRLAVLVGLNGAGKSNLIDGLRFLRESLDAGLEIAITRRGGITSVRRAPVPTGRPADVEIGVELELDDAKGEYRIVIEAVSGGDWRVKSEYFSHSPTLGHRVTFERSAEGVIVSGLTDDDSPTSEVFEQYFSPQALILPLFSGHPGVRAIQQFLSDMSAYSIYPDTLRIPQPPLASYPLAEHGENLASVLRALRTRRHVAADRIRISLAEAVPQVRNYRIRSLGSFLSIQILQNYRGGEHWFEASECSDGTLRLLGLATAIHQEPPRAVVAIEEPELTVHPGAAGILCDELIEASARSQVIITTHSPDLMSRMPVESLRIVEMTENGTEVGPVDPEQVELIQSHMFSTGDILRAEGLRRELK